MLHGLSDLRSVAVDYPSSVLVFLHSLNRDTSLVLLPCESDYVPQTRSGPLRVNGGVAAWPRMRKSQIFSCVICVVSVEMLRLQHDLHFLQVVCGEALDEVELF